jgi:heme-degrading monooxygenase HmoA
MVRSVMIARVWRGYTTAANADAYQSMLIPEVSPGISTVKGYLGSYVLRRSVGDEVEFVTVLLWESIDAVKVVAGPDYERAVIPQERRHVLSRCDETAVHYDVVSTQSPRLSTSR